MQIRMWFKMWGWLLKSLLLWGILGFTLAWVLASGGVQGYFCGCPLFEKQIQ